MLYFIAIVVPPGMNEHVMRWKKYMEQHYGCKVALRSPGHITLVPPFSMQEEKEEELINCLKEFCSHETSFDISVSNFDHFKPRVIFLHVDIDEHLSSLKARLDLYLLSLAKFPIKKELRPFHPHITIANRDLHQKDFPHAWSHFKHLSYKSLFRASNISLLKHNNQQWQIIFTFPLH